MQFIDEEYSKEADVVRLVERYHQDMLEEELELMLSRPVIEGMNWSLIASSSGWKRYVKYGAKKVVHYPDTL